MSTFSRSTPGALLLAVLTGLLAGFATLVLAMSLARAQPVQHEESPDAGTFLAPPAGWTAAASISPAQAETTPPADDIATIEVALRGVRQSDLGWQTKVGLILVAIVALLRRYATRIPWRVGEFFASSEGGSVLLFLVTTLGGIGSALAVGGSFDWWLVRSTVALGITTAGGFHVFVKPLYERVWKPLLAKVKFGQHVIHD